VLPPTGMPDLSSMPIGDTGRSDGAYGDNLNSIQPVLYLAVGGGLRVRVARRKTTTLSERPRRVSAAE
jgi:hypothetical protein